MGAITETRDDFFYSQRKTVFEYLQKHTATASMIEAATGIHHKNICRYKRDLELSGDLAEVERKRCIKTGFKAWYLTTNPALFPTPLIQLSLF